MGSVFPFNIFCFFLYKYKTGIRETHWQAGVWLWNDQNYEYNNYAPSWFPKYKKLDENIRMPDYTKLR